MPQYRKIQETVNADQWNRTGDLSGDKPLVNGEGRIVRNYKRKDVHDAAPCIICTHPMRAHGWIDALLPDGAMTRPVDPVTGKAAVVANVAPSEFPKVFTKENEANRTVYDAAEAKTAVADGYTVVPKSTVPAMVGPVEVEPEPTSDERFHDGPLAVEDRSIGRGRRRGGLVVCPGDYIITYSNGEMETCSPSVFPALYVKSNPNESVPFSSAARRK